MYKLYATLRKNRLTNFDFFRRIRHFFKQNLAIFAEILYFFPNLVKNVINF